MLVFGGCSIFHHKKPRSGLRFSVFTGYLVHTENEGSLKTFLASPPFARAKQHLLMILELLEMLRKIFTK